MISSTRRLVGLCGFFLAAIASCGDTPDAALRAAIAEGCSINSECASPLVCAFRTCHVECTTKRDCVAFGGGLCVQSDKPYRVCQNEDETTCVLNSECPGNQTCGPDAKCRDACVTNRDCGDKQTCTAGACADAEDLIDGKLPSKNPPTPSGGSSCLRASDCPGDLVCKFDTCTVECVTAKDCEDGLACVGSRCASPGVGGAAGAAGIAGGSGRGGSAGLGGSGGTTMSGGASGAAIGAGNGGSTTGNAGNGTAGSGTAGNGTAGSGTAGNGTSGSTSGTGGSAGAGGAAGSAAGSAGAAGAGGNAGAGGETGAGGSDAGGSDAGAGGSDAGAGGSDAGAAGSAAGTAGNGTGAGGNGTGAGGNGTGAGGLGLGGSSGGGIGVGGSAPGAGGGAGAGGASLPPLQRCDGFNDASAPSVAGSWGDRYVAFQYVPTADRTVAGVDWFTGRGGPQDGPPFYLALFDDAAGKPGSPIVPSSTFIVPGGPDDWYGGRLSTPVDVKAGTVYWIVWRPNGGTATVSSTPGTAVSYRGSEDLTTWDGPYSGPWMIRVQCPVP